MNGVAKCVLISTGGTIASRQDPGTESARPALTGHQLIQEIPDLHSLAEIEISEPFCVASPEIQPETHWALLRDVVRQHIARADVSCVVITHGTALMEETAWFLELTLDSAKPVILTGAQRNASEPYRDGPFNILNAVRVGLCPDMAGLGVVIVMNQRIHAALAATKHHTFDINAFDSGERAVIGHVTPSGIEIHRQRAQRLHIPWNEEFLPAVAILPMYAGARGDLIHAAAEHYTGIVIQGVGAGHVNRSMYQAIHQVINQGCTVVITTRVPYGGARPCYGFTGSSQQLKDIGAVIAGALPAWKARILLMLTLSTKTDPFEAFSKLDTGSC